MKPKALSEREWNCLKEKYKINLKFWENLDGIKKLAFLKNCINISPYPIFSPSSSSPSSSSPSSSSPSSSSPSSPSSSSPSPSSPSSYDLQYPRDLFNVSKAKKYILDVITLNTIRHYTIREEKKEIGGIILYNTNGFHKVKTIFSGNENRIQLDLNSRVQTLFHTHPDDNLEFDPPSILDIISFLSLNIKSVAEYILNREKNGDRDIEEIVKIQNSMVFTKNEVYVYYISYPLLKNITSHLMELYNKEDFIFEVEKLLELVEIHYSYILFPYNRNLNTNEIDEYISFLSTLGIIVKRFTYLSPPESYIF